eukprot:c22183_g1_i1 orf=269-1006(-)
MRSELLSIRPGELKFPFELKKQVSCTMQLVNTTDNCVAFKVKTTSPKKYCVRPTTGIILPQGTCDVTVTMQGQQEAPPDMQCKDKFLVQSVISADGVTSKDISQDMFNKETGKEVYESKLRVVYVSPPQLPSCIPESTDEGVSPSSSPVVDNGSQTNFGYDMAPKDTGELRAKLFEAQASIARLTEEKKAAIHLTEKLQQEIARMAMKSKGKNSAELIKTTSGFSFSFVLIVGILGILVGYLVCS